jgi:UPF0716 protein FxsA
MFFRLLLLFLFVPLIELTLLIWLGSNIGLMPTLLVVLITAILGAALSRQQGLATMGRIQRELSAGRMPGDALVDGLLILIAGGMLLTPGILSDTCGFVLLIPAVRRWLLGRLKRRFASYIQVSRFPHGRTAESEIIEARVIESSEAD